MHNNQKLVTDEREWSIKELAKNKSFPFAERAIRDYIRKGKLKVKRYGFKTIRITQSSINAFLKDIEAQNDVANKKL